MIALQVILHLRFHFTSLATHNTEGNEKKQSTVQGTYIVYLVMIWSFGIGITSIIQHLGIVQLLEILDILEIHLLVLDLPISTQNK